MPSILQPPLLFALQWPASNACSVRSIRRTAVQRHLQFDNRQSKKLRTTSTNVFDQFKKLPVSPLCHLGFWSTGRTCDYLNTSPNLPHPTFPTCAFLHPEVIPRSFQVTSLPCTVRARLLEYVYSTVCQTACRQYYPDWGHVCPTDRHTARGQCCPDCDRCRACQHAFLPVRQLLPRKRLGVDKVRDREGQQPPREPERSKYFVVAQTCLSLKAITDHS